MIPQYAFLARKRFRPRTSTDDERLSHLAPSSQQQAPLPTHATAGWSASQVAALQRRAGNRATLRALGRSKAPLALTYMPASAARAVMIMRWSLRRLSDNTVRRISIPRTTTTNAHWARVPDDHLARVEAAVAIINRQLTSRRLINYFRDNAPGGTVNTLQQVAARARVWEARRTGSMGLSYRGGSDMAYDIDMYRIGRWQIAATLLHEMLHLAGATGAEGQEARAENTIDAARVYAPMIRRVRPRSAAPGDTVTISGISFGPSQESTDRVTLNGVDVGRVLSWRWQHAGQGQIRFRVPEGATSGPLVVENNTVRSNAVQLTVVGAEGGGEEPAPATEAAPAPAPEPAAETAD